MVLKHHTLSPFDRKPQGAVAAGSSMKPSRQTAAREKIRFAMLRAPFPTLCMGYYSARM